MSSSTTLRQEVKQAFSLLQLEQHVDYSTALKAYKRLALIHHPDRNHGDPSATERFQQIGAAWNICQKHYDNPTWSHIPDINHHSYTRSTSQSFNTYTFDDDDDDDYYFMDQDDLHAYYMFMFAETLANRFSRARGKHYRHQRSRASGVYSYVPDEQSQASQQERQRLEKLAYEKRKRQLELEIEAEERQKEKAAKDAQADQDRRASIVDNIFQAAYAGHSSAVRNAILEHDLDVNAPRKRAKHTRNQDQVVHHESLLHVAASHCDDDLVMFLVERGADTKVLNKQQLTPFHAAIKAGNTRVVRFIMERRGRSFEGYHPSKAAPSGRTPLQLAIDSHQTSMIELLVREATTHDVERCWKHQDLSDDIKNILRTKKGFVPPEEAQRNPVPTLSAKKGHRKQPVSQQKAAQLALEQERARINREKREERAAKRAEQEGERKAQQEAEEYARKEAELAEQLRSAEEERQREESLRKAEEEERQREGERRQREEQERERRQREEQEQERQHREEQEKLWKAKEQQRLEAERENERLRKVELERQRQKVIVEANRQAEERQVELKKQQQKTALSVVTKLQGEQATTQEPLLLSPSASTSRPNLPTKRRRLTEDERKEIKREKQREKRRTKAAVRVQTEQQHARPEVQTPRTMKVTTQLRTNKKPEDMTSEEREEYEQVLRRRAEQSARDRQRAQMKREKRAQPPTSPSPGGYIPLTPVSTHTRSRYQTPEQVMAIQPDSVDTMGLENIQTCIVPDDLFKEDEPGCKMYGDFATTVGPIDELFLKEVDCLPYVRV